MPTDQHTMKEEQRLQWMLRVITMAAAATFASYQLNDTATYLINGLAGGVVLTFAGLIIIVKMVNRITNVKLKILLLAELLTPLYAFLCVYFLLFVFTDAVIPQAPTSQLGITLIVGITTGYLWYELSRLLEHYSLAHLVAHTAVGLITGVILSIAISGSSEWWIRHFSALGASGNIGSWIFDITLLTTSTALALIGYFVSMRIKDILIQHQIPHAWRVRITQILFLLVAIMGYIAATISYADNFILHDTAAKLISVFIALFIVISPWILPVIPRAFIILSYVMVLACTLAWPYVQSQTLKLSLYEIITTLSVLMWLRMFVRLISPSDVSADHGTATSSEHRPIGTAIV